MRRRGRGVCVDRRSAQGWSADPEEQFLLDVNIRQLRLGDGVRAYNTPEGTCVLFGDLVKTLDLPIKIDLAAKNGQRMGLQGSQPDLDRPRLGESRPIRDKSEPIAAGTVHETPDGWCVETNGIGRWFGIGVKPMTSGSALLLESEAKLPVELAMERRKARRSSSSRPSSISRAFRRCGCPIACGARRRSISWSAGASLIAPKTASRSIAIRQSMRPVKLRDLSYDAQLPTNQKGFPNALRLHAYRSDPDGKLLGPLKATHFGFGESWRSTAA